MFYLDHPDPIVFLSVVVNTSGRLTDDFVYDLLLWKTVVLSSRKDNIVLDLNVTPFFSSSWSDLIGFYFLLFMSHRGWDTTLVGKQVSWEGYRTGNTMYPWYFPGKGEHRIPEIVCHLQGVSVPPDCTGVVVWVGGWVGYTRLRAWCARSLFRVSTRQLGIHVEEDINPCIRVDVSLSLG